MANYRIAWLFPDTLYLHGERGNLLALARLAQLAGLNPDITKISFRTKNFNPFDYDIIYVGSGELCALPDVITWLEPYKKDIYAYMESGKPLIATGTAMAIFGKDIKGRDGRNIDGLKLINIECREIDNFKANDLYYECSYNQETMEIIGVQVQMTDIEINDERSFGIIKSGYGNNGKDNLEGVRIFNSIFTNTLGPILVNNPWLTAGIIEVSCRYSGIDIEGFYYDDTVEKASFNAKKSLL